MEPKKNKKAYPQVRLFLIDFTDVCLYNLFQSLSKEEEHAFHAYKRLPCGKGLFGQQSKVSLIYFNITSPD